jgi:hypothetical protein
MAPVPQARDEGRLEMLASENLLGVEEKTGVPASELAVEVWVDRSAVPSASPLSRTRLLFPPPGTTPVRYHRTIRGELRLR